MASLSELLESDDYLASQDIVDPLGLTHDLNTDAKDEIAGLGQQALDLQSGWMDYLKSEYAPYSEVGRDALYAQRGLSGLGGEGVREQLISDIMDDPLYQAKLEAGNDAVLRGASATGGLRSGDASSALATQNQAVLSREIDTRYQRLAGLSGKGFAGQQAMGQQGGEAMNQMTGTLGELANLSMTQLSNDQDQQTGLMGLVGNVFSAFSDKRLKGNVEQIGEKAGLPWYKWTWNDIAGKKFGLRGEAVGFMASDVELVYPECVGTREGYMVVNYGGVV